MHLELVSILLGFNCIDLGGLHSFAFLFDDGEDVRLEIQGGKRNCSSNLAPRMEEQTLEQDCLEIIKGELLRNNLERINASQPFGKVRTLSNIFVSYLLKYVSRTFLNLK